MQAIFATQLAIIAADLYTWRMTAEELLALRKRVGWTQREMARRLDISVSRLADYEKGETRGPAKRDAPIPKTVEYAVRWITRGLDRAP